MKKSKKEALFTALSLIAVGILFVIFKSEIISIALTFIGGYLVVWGIVNVINKLFYNGIVKIVFGALVLVAGWLFIQIALYLLGAFLLISGASDLYRIFKNKIKKVTISFIARIIQPIIYVMVAVCLFFNQGAALSWVFIVSGVFLMLDGVVALVGALDK